MAKKKKRGGEAEVDPDAVVIKPAGPVGTKLGELLKGVSIAKPDPKAKAAAKPGPHLGKPGKAPPPPRPAPLPPPVLEGRPSETLKGPERIAYLDALAGVRPMKGRLPQRIGAVARPAAPPTREEANRDQVARERLTALVAGGVKFDVYREDGWIEGLRRDAKPAIVQALRKAQIGERDTLDLHGLRAHLAEDRLARFLREQHRAGVRRVCIVHGRGLHSEGPPVLADLVVKVLTEGAGAPLVMAFVTAPPSAGGAGALLVELTKR